MRRLLGLVAVCVVAGSSCVGFGSVGAQPNAPAIVEIRLDPTAGHTPAIGVNEFGDSGGIQFSAGNLIPDSGFEPISMRRFWRVTATGSDKGYPWIEVDGGGMTDWDLVTTGYLNGATYRIYRIVDAAGEPLRISGDYLDTSRADRFVRVGVGRVPDAGARGLRLGGWVDEPGEQRIYLDGPAPRAWDYIVFDKRTIDPDPRWSHPRLAGNGHTDAVSETWRRGWGSEQADIELARRPHGAPPPPQMRFPGDTAFRVTSRARGIQSVHGPYIFFPINDNPEGNWYGTLEPGQTYRYEVWMRQEGLGDAGRVELGFFSLYDGIAESFTVDGSWRRYGYTFTAPDRPTRDGWHGGPAVRFTGPGVLEMDNIRLFRIDAPEQADALFVPSPMMIDELLRSQPEHGEKGFIRSMSVLMNNATMASLLSTHRDAEIVYDWYIAVQPASNMTLPRFLDYTLRTGDSPGTRMKPWLNVSSRASEEEWLMLMEYLAAPIDPTDPADVEAKPWAFLRYTQRGIPTPWTDEFAKITVEFANETWHNRAVEDQWHGWHRFHWVHQGSHEFGLWAEFIGTHLRRNSPWFSAARDAGTIELLMGSNYQDYAERALPYTSEVTAIGHTTYVGPRWETGDEPNSVFDDHGVQATLLGYAAGLDREFDRYRQQREALASSGRPYSLYAYEGGPSGYSLPGSAPADAVEVAERYGKSLAMAVASFDAWLAAYQAGFSEMGYLAFAQGGYWSSHTSIREGFRPHAAWLALTMRNRYLSGTMITADVVSAPTIRWAGRTIPLVGAYAFRDGSRVAIALVSRKLGGVRDGVDYGDGSTEVTLRLPAAPVGAATLYALDGDPRASNRFADQIRIRERSVTLGRESTVTLPEGSIHIYVIDT
ncbi:MAG: hypothetical protein EA382_03070, partial [Spirochaetaceae bacterium]